LHTAQLRAIAQQNDGNLQLRKSEETHEHVHGQSHLTPHHQADDLRKGRTGGRQATWEFVTTAFAEALRFWDHNEPITDEGGQTLGTVQIELTDKGEIDIYASDIEVTAREEARQ
jgi:hypothetical protein